MNAIKKYVIHQIIKPFEFHPVSPNDVWNETGQLDNSKKASEYILIDILNLISGLCNTEITKYLKTMLLTSEFPDTLKATVVSSLYKSSESTCKDNYAAISVATAISKKTRRKCGTLLTES